MTRISTLRPRAPRYVVLVSGRRDTDSAQPIASSTTRDGAIAYAVFAGANSYVGAQLIDRSEQRITWPQEAVS